MKFICNLKVTKILQVKDESDELGRCVCEYIVKMVCLVKFRVYLDSHSEKSDQTEKKERPFGSSHDVTNSTLNRTGRDDGDGKFCA